MNQPLGCFLENNKYVSTVLYIKQYNAHQMIDNLIFAKHKKCLLPSGL